MSGGTNLIIRKADRKEVGRGNGRRGEEKLWLICKLNKKF